MGNPTIVATLTVVAALLPMLFVSGMMGPYMSPIPANASAAMIFSFFVAVILTPWLMLKIAGGRRPDGAAHEARPRPKVGALGPALPARRQARSSPRKARAWMFLTARRRRPRSARWRCSRRRTSPSSCCPSTTSRSCRWSSTCPRASSVEDTEPRRCRRSPRRLAAVPEVVSFQTYAGAAAPFNFNGLVRHYALRTTPELGDVQVNLTPKAERERASHAIALDIRQRLADLPVAAGTAIKVVEPPPGPPVLATLLAEIYGPDPETRRAVAAKVREAFAIRAVHRRCRRQLRPAGAARCASRLDQDNVEFHGVEQRDVYDTLRTLQGGDDGRLFPPRRRPPADPDPLGALQGAPRRRRARR